jgi:hypothetical protein
MCTVEILSHQQKYVCPGVGKSVLRQNREATTAIKFWENVSFLKNH